MTQALYAHMNNKIKKKERKKKTCIHMIFIEHLLCVRYYECICEQHTKICT
jgi:hypothetical protein